VSKNIFLKKLISSHNEQPNPLTLQGRNKRVKFMSRIFEQLYEGSEKGSVSETK
jgi:hypothetical protein